MSFCRSVPINLLIIIVLFSTILTGNALSQTCTDADGDGWGVNGDASCPGTGVDCDDTDPTVHPGAQKICDGKDNNCDGKKDFTTDEDKDLDGVPWCAQDCDDNNPNRAPNIIEAPEGSLICTDGIDNDCDNRVDSVDQGCQFSCFDSDGDGYGINGDASCDFPGEIDCNDNDATINPGVVDNSCNGIDNNCSTFIDDEYVIDTLCGVGECLASNTPSSCIDGVETLCIPGSPSPEGVVGSPSCTDGVDNDCDGLSDTDPACQVSCQDFDEDGYGVTVDVSCQSAGIDCDDSNALINPGGDDTNCNGIDEDCVGGADSGYVTDAGCGTGECQTNNIPGSCTGGVETACQPGAPVAEDTPGVGVCTDGLDNDCDGLTDSADSEGCSALDVDDDGDGYTENQNDCNDGDPTMYPGAPKICDGKDNNCDGKKDFTTDEDKDLDGVPWCAGDCDDNNPNRAPNIFEGGFGSAVCTDGIDNDCDNRIDFADLPCQGDCIDTDGDGYGVNGDTSCDIPGEIDCDDTNAAVNPAGDDANCNGIDEDCTGGADSGYIPDTLCGTGECQANNTPSTCLGGVETACQPGAPVLEGPQGDPTCTGGLDEDCDDLIDGNDPGCNTLCIDQDGDGYGANGHASCPNGPAVDCDDSNAAAYPGGDDANCNGIDEDCVGGADSGYVVDASCGTGLCNTTNTPSSCTGGVETLCQEGTPGDENVTIAGTCTDGVDNDCDGDTDAVDSDCSTAEIDNDGDGYCRAAACTDGSSPNDCDDTDPNVYPGAPKICDGKDSNCDGKKDSPTDEDKDLDGVPWCAGDCDDNNPLAYPGNSEGPWPDPTCTDGIDNDCDGTADCPPPTCGTKTSPRNGPHSETMMAPGPDGLPNTGDDITHPENSNLLCGKCHGVNLQDPVRSQCERCHTAGGISKALYPDPWPFGFGSAPDVQMHSSTVLGTKYGAWDMDCVTCHNPHSQEQDGAYGTSYGKYIKEYICFDNPVTALNIESIVEFTAASGPGSFADGPPYVDNICEMCHTLTNHHQNDGDAPGGQSHYDVESCTNCHPHADGFYPTGPQDQSHITHIQGVNGPRISCDSAGYGCHGSFEPPLMADGNDLVSTTVCDNCHSPAGAFDGLNDPDTGAINNWPDGVYNGNVLTTGKEMWCAGCHDDAPSNSMMDGTGVSARNVLGDNATYGFYMTGHGRNISIDCLLCHSSRMPHVDHTYTPVLDVIKTTYNPTNYRLYTGKGLLLPYDGTDAPGNHALCFSCHDQADVWKDTGPNHEATTNFRSDTSGTNYNNNHWSGNHRPNANCIFCHDPHGTAAPRMTVDERVGSFRLLTFNPIDSKYYELTDPALWNSVADNNGGASTGPAACSTCHGYANISNGVTESPYSVYKRLYVPLTFTVVDDTDGDGILDVYDNCVALVNVEQADSDLDGVGDDCDLCLNTSDPGNEDRDRDGIGDVCDVCQDDPDNDIDNDGICAGTGFLDPKVGDNDNCPVNYNPGQEDSDGDGFPDACDNCPSISNSDQADIDLDGIGDVCDASCDSFANIWEQTLGHPINGPWGRLYGSSIDSNENIYGVGDVRNSFSGHTFLGGISDFVIVKYDTNGNFQAINAFGSPDDSWETLADVAVDSVNGFVYVTGYTTGSIAPFTNPDGGIDLVLAKYDSSLNPIWIKQSEVAGSDRGDSLALDSSGNIYLGGTVGYSAALYKFDSLGNQLWVKPIPGSYAGHPYVISMAIYIDGDYIYATGNIDNDVFVKRYDLDGNEVWSSQEGSPGVENSSGIVVTGNNVYVTGMTFGSFPGYTLQGETDVFIIKLDKTNGSLQAFTQFTAPERQEVRGIVANSSETSVYVTGYSWWEFLLPGTGQFDSFLLSFDTDLNTLRRKQLDGGPYNNEIEALSIGTASDSLFLIGFHNNSYYLFMKEEEGCP